MHACLFLYARSQPLLHNGLAVCHMKMGEWEDAERDLQEALGKDAKDADTLANLITVSSWVIGDTDGGCGGGRGGGGLRGHAAQAVHTHLPDQQLS